MLTRMSAKFLRQPTILVIDLPIVQAVLLCSLILLASCKNSDKPHASFEHAQQGIYSAALSRESDQLVLGSINHGGSLWTTADHERRYNWNHRQGDYSQITRVRFSEDQRHVVTAGPQSLVLWNAESGEGDALWSSYSEVLDIAVPSGAEQTLLALADHSAKLFDIQRGGVLRIFNHSDKVNSVDVHSESNIVVTASDDRSIKLWHLSPKDNQVSAREAVANTVLEQSEPVQLVRFSPDGKYLFSMAQYDAAKLWLVVDGTALGELPLGNFAKKRGSLIRSARFNGDGSQLLTGDADRGVKLWDVQEQRLLRHWQTPKRNGMDPQGTAVLDVAFNSDGGYSAITSDGIRHHLL